MICGLHYRALWWLRVTQVLSLQYRVASSEHPLLLEADEPPFADDHVVQEVDAEDLGGGDARAS